MTHDKRYQQETASDDLTAQGEVTSIKTVGLHHTSSLQVLGPSLCGHGPWCRWTVSTVAAGHNTVHCPDGVGNFSLEAGPASPASSTLWLLGTSLGEEGN